MRNPVRSAVATRGVWALLLCCAIACKDRATIGGLCPTGCDYQAEAKLCACSLDGGSACADAACRTDAGACAANGCGLVDDRDACVGPGCSADAGATCAAGSYPLERERLDLLIAIDDAASIVPWWTALSDGLQQFLQDPGSNGIGVGLQRFGRPLPLESCDAQDYLTPIVPIAALPGDLDALLQAIPTATPTATTSTIPVLTGVLEYASGWASANPRARVAVALATDASPGECDALMGDYDTVSAQVASAAHTGSPAIDTYVVGFGALQTLGTIAAAGGTSLAAISLLPTDAEVLTAFETIRGAAQPCAFAWPDGMTLAPISQVVITPASGAEERYDIQRGASSCDHDGFYVDDANASDPLNACPRTCAALGASDRLSLSSACSK